MKKEKNQPGKILIAVQNKEEKIATELISANKEIDFQHKEKGKRAAELVIANKELAYQTTEKGKRAAELLIANKELIFQNEEKEKRAAELAIANKELAFQNKEKEKKALELMRTNKELAFQIQEKEKREGELLAANKELLAFTYISSHDLQEPLRKIQVFASRIMETESQNLSEQGKGYFERMQILSERMQQLIIDLLVYSRINTVERPFEKTDLSLLVDDIKNELSEKIAHTQATILVNDTSALHVIPFQFRQLLHNLISNALKFSRPAVAPVIRIKSELASGHLAVKGLVPEKNYTYITIEDNGIGFEPEFNERIFGVFQKLHQQETYTGTGIGLAIVKKIIENHHGFIFATGELNKGAKFELYIPAQ